MTEVFHKAAIRTSGRLAGLACLVMSAAGCMSYRASDQSRMSHAPDAAVITQADWPVRDTGFLEKLRESTPSDYYKLELTGKKPVEEVRPRLAAYAAEPELHVIYNEVIGPGLLRVVRDPSQPQPEDLKSWHDVHQGFHPNAWYLTSLEMNDPRRRAFAAQQRRFRAQDERGSPDSGVRYTNTDITTALKDGIPICLPPIQKTPPRGLLIHFVAMMGNAYETSVMTALRQQGWAVIDIDSNPRLMGGGNTYTVKNDQDVDEAAASIAHRVDDVLAEHAYAAEAALEYCRKNRTDLPTGRVAIIGFSAGSLVVPTVAARLGDDVEAAVLIAGGANLLEIAMDSTLSDGGIKIKWGPGRGDEADKARLNRAYLDKSKLDPYHTATTLASKPVLQYWGQWDRWVPAQSGALLNQQLNSPDKVTCLGGHMLLFYFLPTQSNRICDWIGRAMEPATRTARLHTPVAPGGAASVTR